MELKKKQKWILLLSFQSGKKFCVGGKIGKGADRKIYRYDDVASGRAKICLLK